MRKKMIITGVLGLGLAGLVAAAGPASSATSTKPKPRPVACEGIALEAVPGTPSKPGVPALRAVPVRPGKAEGKPLEFAVPVPVSPDKPGVVSLRAVPARPGKTHLKPVETAIAIPAIPGKIGKGAPKVTTEPVCVALSPAEPSR